MKDRAEDGSIVIAQYFAELRYRSDNNHEWESRYECICEAKAPLFAVKKSYISEEAKPKILHFFNPCPYFASTFANFLTIFELFVGFANSRSFNITFLIWIN